MIALALLRAVPLGLALLGIGLLFDELCRLRLATAGLAAWPARACLGLALVFAVAVDPLALAMIAALALLLRRTRPHPVAAPDIAVTGSARLFASVLVVAVLIVAARPPTALYWDEFVWLAKARIESHGWGALRAASLDPGAGVIPQGYPILWPLATAWFAAFRSDAGSLLAGSAILRLVALALFTSVAIAGDGSLPGAGTLRRSGVAIAALALTPLLFVHLRAAYVDLPVGLLAAALMLALVRHREDPVRFESMAAVAAIAAFIIAGAKDEGLAHVVAITAIIAATTHVERRRSTWLACGATLTSALIPFAAWKLLTRMHHVVDADHQLGLPHLASIPGLGFAVIRHATDLHSWAAFWPMFLAALAVLAVRRGEFSASTRTLALVVIAQACMLAIGVVCGPERVRVFAFDGTLINRLLIQLAPAAAMVLAMVIAEAVQFDPSAARRNKRPAISAAGLVLLLGCIASQITACAPNATRESLSPLLVVAPHPDDETLIAAGVVRRARSRGQKVSVVIVTNGDFTCERNGWLRQRESVAALALLGVAETDVHFLGYPDGHLAELGAQPSPAYERRDASGRCIRANTTYADHGENHRDEHSARTGRPASYSAAALTEDLAAVLARVRPREIYVTHPIDRHPDHASTYTFLRRALERTALPGVRIHRAIVHAGPCWPNGRTMYEPCPAVHLDPGAPFTPLPDPLGAYLPSERVRVPAEMRAAGPDVNLKYRAIASYPSQTGPDPATNWLTSFARSEEAFFPEELVPDPARPGGLLRARARNETSVALRSPFHVRFGLRCEPNAAYARVRFAASGSAASPSGYLIAFEPVSSRIALTHERQLPLPALVLGRFHATSDADRHAYDIYVDPRPDEGGVTEITVVRDGEIFAVAVDPAAIEIGERRAFEADGACVIDGLDPAAGRPGGRAQVDEESIVGEVSSAVTVLSP